MHNIRKELEKVGAAVVPFTNFEVRFFYFILGLTFFRLKTKILIALLFSRSVGI